MKFLLMLLYCVLFLKGIYSEALNINKTFQTLTYKPQDGLHRSRREAITGLRIKLIFTPKFNNYTNSKYIKEKFIYPAVDFFQSTLTARKPTTEPIRLARSCIDDVFVVAKYANGSYVHLCSKGCKSESLCSHAVIPPCLLDSCKAYSNKNIVTTGISGSGMENTDFILFVDRQMMSTCRGTVLAFAGSCQHDTDLNRPIAGYMNLCPSFSYSTRADVQMASAVILHEMAHSLGFAFSDMAFYRKPDGSPWTLRNSKTGLPNEGRDPSTLVYLPSKQTVDNVNQEWVSAKTKVNISQPYLILPNTRNAAQKHYNCDSMIGMPLQKTVKSHWLPRAAVDEVMSSTIIKKAYISNITLSLFYDMGWYYVNFNKAQDWKFAKNIGCDFILKSCYEFIKIQQAKKQSIQPYCNFISSISKEYPCMQWENAYGSCFLSRFVSKLAPEHVYFDSIEGVSSSLLEYYGGSYAAYDYCPLVLPVTFNRDHFQTSYCDDIDNAPVFAPIGNWKMQYFGSNATCVSHSKTIMWEGRNCTHRFLQGPPASTCHKKICDPKRGLVIVMGSKEFPCPINGGNIDLSTFDKARGYWLKAKGTCLPCQYVCPICPSSSSAATKPDTKPSTITCSANPDPLPHSDAANTASSKLIALDRQCGGKQIVEASQSTSTIYDNNSSATVSIRSKANLKMYLNKFTFLTISILSTGLIQAISK